MKFNDLFTTIKIKMLIIITFTTAYIKYDQTKRTKQINFTITIIEFNNNKLYSRTMACQTSKISHIIAKCWCRVFIFYNI